MNIKEMQQGQLYRDGLYLSGGKIRKAKLPGNIASSIWSSTIHKCHQCGEYYILFEKHEFYLILLTPEHKPSSVKFVRCSYCPPPNINGDEYNIAISSNRKQGVRNILDGGYFI